MSELASLPPALQQFLNAPSQISGKNPSEPDSIDQEAMNSDESEKELLSEMQNLQTMIDAQRQAIQFADYGPSERINAGY
ncbi:hypothetical protein [Pseudomonas synxantha]|uniref:hypothetical protein n=1 Tax=Pseudomonas synxantha TaxID=47883 RepID=UPI000F58CAD7|nr:hypothetical protein [Pseudomonas synxantha]AZE60228.1 hypothetical protein C4K02_1852 [Pseudomonas synxantha]